MDRGMHWLQNEMHIKFHTYIPHIGKYPRSTFSFERGAQFHYTKTTFLCKGGGRRPSFEFFLIDV